MEYILAIFLGYRNGLIARRKGKSTILWVVITVLAFIVGQVIGGMIVAAFFFKEAFDPKGDVMERSREFSAFLIANPVSLFFTIFSGVGGYLFIHYLLSKKPDLPQQDDTL